MRWRFPLAILIVAILSQLVHTVGSFIGMKYYLLPEYFSVWSKLMMPEAGPPPTSFFLYSLLFGIIGGILLALVYQIVEKSLLGKTRILKGLFFGLLVIMVAQVPGTLMMILIINLPAFLIVSWFIEGCLIALLSGIIFAKVLKPETFFSKLFNR